MTRRGGAESRPRGDEHRVQIVPIVRGVRSVSNGGYVVRRGVFGGPSEQVDATRTTLLLDGRQLQDGNAQALGVSAWRRRCTPRRRCVGAPS